MRSWYVLMPALCLAACTGGQRTPPPPRSVARPVESPPPYRTANTVAGPSAPLPVGGAVHWHSRLADAQAEARSTGRLLLVGTTKPECSICDKFVHTIAPRCAGRLNQVAVAFLYDITRDPVTHPDVARLDSLMRANLPGAILMPLVGFLTPELGWVHGFGGPRTEQEFMGDIETAARMRPLRSASARSVTGPAMALVSFVNEFGESESSVPADAWPKPLDALGPQPVLALAPSVPVEPPTAALAAAPAPDAAPSISDAPVITRVEPSADPEAGWSAPPPAPEPAAAPAAAPEPGPAFATARVVASAPIASPEPGPMPPSAAPVPLAPLRPPAPSAIAAVPMNEGQARATLAQAFELIRRGDYDRARDELRQVSRSLPYTSVGREADRGGVAIYNARRIAEAGSEERADLSARARRALSGTMWEQLF